MNPDAKTFGLRSSADDDEDETRIQILPRSGMVSCHSDVFI